MMLKYLDVLFPPQMLASLGSGHLPDLKKSSLTKMQELSLLQKFAREQTRGDRNLPILCGAGLGSRSGLTFSILSISTPHNTAEIHSDN